MTNQEAEVDVEAELVSTIQGLEAFLQKIDRAEEGLEDEFPMPPEDADTRDELIQKRQQAIAECQNELQVLRNRSKSLLHDTLKRLQLHRETGSVLTQTERDQADELAREIADELREFCPPALNEWDGRSHEEKKRIVADKLRNIERHLAFEEDPNLDAYRQDLKSEWDHLQRLEELDSETRFDPVDEAKTLFDGMERPEGADTKISSKVTEWATRSHQHYMEKKGLGSEPAKTSVLNLAEQNDYHFSRSWLEKQLTTKV